MKLGKAIVSGIILYAVIFLAASAMLTLSSTTFGFIMVILVAVLTFIVSKYFYFKGMQVANPVKEGILLGLALVIVMFIIEVPVMVYGFAKDLGWAYFNTWHIVLGYGLALITPVFAAPRKLAVKKFAAPKRKPGK